MEARVLSVLREMLQDRGFGEVSRCTDAPGGAGRLKGANPSGGICYAYYLGETDKLGIAHLRKISAAHGEEADLRSLIIVCKDGTTPFARRELTQDGGKWADISVFCTRQVRENITRHMLVPRHVRCGDGEVKAVLARHELASVMALPFISDQDPVVRYYNFPVGAVLRIERRNGEQETEPYYRTVVAMG